jgi:hypothetical protein
MKSGHVIKLVGLDNHDDRRGAGLWFVVLDECADVKAAAWEETIDPMLATANGHALFTGTPKGFNWFYDLHNRHSLGKPGWKSYTFTTLQGGNVSPERIARYRAEKDARTFRQEFEASFETYAGRVIYAFSRAKHVKPCHYDPTCAVYVGMDFNINPMSAAIWQETDGIDYQIDEIVMPGSDTVQMCAELKHRFARNGKVDHIQVFPDASGRNGSTSAGVGVTNLSILRGADFRINALSGNPAVSDRSAIMNGRFEAADGTIRAYIDPKCVHSIKSIEGHVYKEGSSIPDKDGATDHLVDATGYYFYTRYGQTQAKYSYVGWRSR